MIPARYRIIVPTALSIVGGCSLVAVIDPNRHEHVAIGFILGTLFGQTTLAAAWTALGPLPLMWRLPFSFLWLSCLMLAFAGNIWMYGHGSDVSFWLATGCCLVSQWFLVQIPLWCCAALYCWRLRPTSDPQPRVSEWQFGIRQLGILTTVVAIVLGTARAVLARLPNETDLANRSTLIVVFLALAAILMTLPLIIAGLLPRHSVPASAVVLVLIALATIGELPILQQLDRSMQKNGPDMEHLIWINVFTSGWIVALVLAVRLSGYGISWSEAATASSAVIP